MAKTALGLLAGYFLLALTIYCQNQPVLTYNFEYSCNNERVVVGHCRRDSDQPGYPRTTDADNFCMVYYPDRPKQGGFEVQKVELRGDLVKKLQDCGALKAQVSDQPSSPDEIDESVVEFHRGDALYKKGDYASSLPHFKHSNEIAVSSAAYAMIGITQYHLKQYREAIEPLKQAIRMAPENPEAHFWLGMTYRELGMGSNDQTQYANAEAELREAVRLKPDYQEAYRWLGAVLSLELKDQEAIKTFQQALRLDPNDSFAKYLEAITYARMGQKETAMQLYREAAAADPTIAPDMLTSINNALKNRSAVTPGTAEYFLNEGNKLRDKEDYADAIEQYKKALALKSSLGNAHFNLGYSYFQLKQFQTALMPLQQAVKLDPKDADYQYWLGSTYSRLKQYDKAVPILQEAVRLKPTDPYYHNNLADAYLYGPKQYSKAELEYREALRLKPDYIEVHNQLGLAYLWQDQYQTALTEFQTALKLNNKEPVHYENVGIAYFRLGKKAEAMQMYEQLRKIDAAKAKELLDLINSPPPSKADSLTTQAIAYYGAKDYTNAIETCKKALVLDPKSSEVLGYLALSYRHTKQWQLALDAFAKYFAVKRPYFDGILLYGSTYVELENYAKAIPLFQQALGLATKPDEKNDANWKLGDAYYEIQDYAKALEPFRQITLSDPKDDDALYHLGMCYMFTGKKAEAQQVQKKLEPLNKISGGNLQGWIDGMK